MTVLDEISGNPAGIFSVALNSGTLRKKDLPFYQIPDILILRI
jgi:hypothetical protein